MNGPDPAAGPGVGDAARADATGAARVDAGRADAGREDAGREDAGREDAGREDAGREDAGREDAAGPSDAGADGLVRRLRAAGCVFAEDEARLLTEAASGPGELEALVRRRVVGQPLEHLLGWAEFAGLRIAVAPGVFVPRRRTEALAHEAVALLRGHQSPVVVDLCCGAGVIGAAVASALSGGSALSTDRGSSEDPRLSGDPGLSEAPGWSGAATLSGEPARPRPSGVELHAAEIDPVAVACARRTLAPFGGHVHHGDLDAPLPPDLRGRVIVLVANVPYVPTDAIAWMPPEARDHEPRTALDGGPDGLDIARRVAEIAPGWLAPGGHLLIETGEEQAPELATAFARAGLAPRVVTDDDRGATLVVGTLA